jgi:hypothetical protein
MTDLIFHSGLTDFQILERLVDVRRTAMVATVQFERAPLFHGVEAMAQLGALHTRHRLDFQRHAFLLKVTQCDLPDMDCLEGSFYVKARLNSQSNSAFDYTTKLLGGHQEILRAELLIGTAPYDDRFQKVLLQVHYQRWFDQLSHR